MRASLVQNSRYRNIGVLHLMEQPGRVERFVVGTLWTLRMSAQT